MSTAVVTKAFVEELFPPQRTDAFFDALFGDAEEGAYTIRLVLRKVEPEAVHLAFDLHQRPGKCLVCSLTYGLPQVFQRHPIIDVAGIARAVAKRALWSPDEVKWTLGRTEEKSASLHSIPFTITPK